MENKNVVLAVVLSIAILVGWNFYEQSRLEDTIAQKGGQQTTDATGQPGSAMPQPDASARQQATTQSAAAPDGAQPIRPRGEVIAEGQRVTIDTPRLTGSINLTGARVDDLTLSKYHETTDKQSDNIVLFSPAGTAKPYYAQYGWWVGEGVAGPTGKAVWTADKDTLKPGSPVTLSWTNPDGITFQQVYAIDENYMFTVTQRVVNDSGQAIPVAPYGLVSRTGTPNVLGYYILHEGLVGVFDKTLKEVDYDDLQNEPAEKQATTGGWLGITDKYWLASLVPDQQTPVKTSFKATSRGSEYTYQSDFLEPVENVAAGATAESTNRLFAGAKETTLLDRYQDELGIVNFDLAVDFGWFYFLTKPIFLALHWLNGVLGNFGVAILILTLGIKLLLFPLANKSYVSMSKMKLLQPKMQELKEKHGDDRQKLNQEMMGLYKKEKVNPLSGCLPILVQIPIFFSLYKVLFVTIEMRHAPFFGWIQDLSAKDPLGLLELFGLFSWNVPAALDVVNIGVWPLIMGFTMWLQQRLNPTPADPVQAKVFTFMPIAFTFILATFPAGLVIYWTCNNLLSVIQQWVIMKRMGVAVGGGKVKA